jgi:hypothetical protein
MVLTKRLHFFFFRLPKAEQGSLRNWLPNWQLKTLRRANTLQGIPKNRFQGTSSARALFVNG